MKTDKERGLYQKYIVIRADGDPKGIHEEDSYFVLNLETDKFAIHALKAYILACREEYPLLAKDLETIVDILESRTDDAII